MNTFIYPACLLILIFWGSFWFAVWVMSRRLKPLDRRVKRLEKMMGKNTEDFSQPQHQTTPQPPKTPRSRYVTVDREMNSNWVRHQ